MTNLIICFSLASLLLHILASRLIYSVSNRSSFIFKFFLISERLKKIKLINIEDLIND